MDYFLIVVFLWKMEKREVKKVDDDVESSRSSRAELWVSSSFEQEQAEARREEGERDRDEAKNEKVCLRCVVCVCTSILFQFDANA